MFVVNDEMTARTPKVGCWTKKYKGLVSWYSNMGEALRRARPDARPTMAQDRKIIGLRYIKINQLGREKSWEM
jgi:hypothetical protein